MAEAIRPYWKESFSEPQELEGEEALQFFDSAGSGWIREELEKTETDEVLSESEIAIPPC